MVKNVVNKIKELPLSKKIQIICAILLTICFIIVIPVYAWFTNQKKAAEMFKVQYPNALYINAAHREDQMYFDLDGININEYAKDPVTGMPIYRENANGELEGIKVEKFRYVFSVSGSSTDEFTLQMAHTTNNLFTYTLYEAEQYTSCTENDDEGGVPISYTLVGQDITGTQKTTTISETDKDRIVVYKQHSNSHNENRVQVIGDEFVDSAEDVIYYVRDEDATDKDSTGYKNKSGSHAIKSTSGSTNSYYNKTYGGNLNVEEHSVPLYWQKNYTITEDSNKNFCKYFVLEVTWNEREQGQQTEKETDMIYFSVKRIS